MSKEYLTTIRLTEGQRNFVDEEAERQGVSIAEVFRRIIDEHRSTNKVIVSIDGPEWMWVEDFAEALKETPSKAIRVALIHYRQIMECPLSEILKTPDKVIEELSRRKQ